MANNFIVRFVTSFILLTIFTIIFLLQLNYTFLLIIFILIYLELFNNKIINIYSSMFSFLSYCFSLIAIDYIYDFVLNYRVFIFPFFIIITVASFTNISIFLNKIFFNIFIFLCFIFFTLLYIYNYNLFFIIILLTSINDILAYMIGSFLKGPKIIPIISPNKTWSGTSLSYLISLSLLFYFFNFNYLFNIIIPATFFIGDIYFSNFKRIIKIKDYGNFIKGHGGFLDRFDSSFLSLSISYLILLFI